MDGIDIVSYMMGKAAGGGGGGGGGVTILSGNGKPSAGQGSNGDVYLNYVADPPAGYALAEYLYGDGTQYIDTGVPARVQLRVEIDCKWNGSGDQTVVGGNGNTNTTSVYLGYNSTNLRSYVGYANSWHDFDTGAIDHYRHNWIIDLKTGTQTIKVDGEVKATTSDVFSESTSSTTLYAFSRSTGGSGFNGYIYAIKIYDYLANEALIRHLVPMVRQADSAAGLYDLANDVFYVNIGSGSFTAGPTVTGGSVTAAYAKVNGVWQPLVGTDINNINLGA